MRPHFACLGCRFSDEEVTSRWLEFVFIGGPFMSRRASTLGTPLLALALFALCPAASQAQSSFGFSIGSGGHGGHHHHHHGHHRGGWCLDYGVGPWWGPAYYPPPAVIYAPPPVVQERVIYVQPQAPPLPVSPYSNTAPRATNSLTADSSPSLAGSTANDDRIVIRNAAGVRLPVAFVVDGQDVELADSGTRTFVGKTQRTIQYDRGGRFGSTQQDLTGGQYEFRITSSGWDLVRRPDLVPSSRTAIRANSLPESGVAR
jgi:hypothetical protein